MLGGNLKKFKKILCVISPEGDFKGTLERAVSLAENSGAELTLCDVIPADTVGYEIPDIGPAPHDLRERVKQDRRDALKTLSLPYCRRIEIRYEVMLGRCFIEIIRLVQKDGYDLVMKPAENPSFLSRLFGSEDMHLLRKCPCPVWLSAPDEASGHTAIVAAVDFETERSNPVQQSLNQRILEAAILLALSDQSRLHIVHVWDAPAEMTIRSYSDNPDADSSAYIEGERVRHQKGLDDLAEQAKALVGEDVYATLKPRFHLYRGTPGAVIPELATRLGAGLVVMGTIARTGIPGLIIGNTAETVLGQLSCSVLTMKPADFISPVV